MPSIRRILLVLDPSLSRTPAVERAEALARQTRAELWLGLFDRGPRLGLLGVLDRDDSHRIEALMREQLSTRLGELREQFVEMGLTVHTIDDPERMSCARILERVARHDIDLVIKDVGHESALRRMVFLPLDWELLRNCPVPLWMVGAGATGLPRRVVAAVDPLNPEHGTGPLNDAILDMARLLSDAAAGDLRVFTAFAGLPGALQAIDPVGISLSSSYEDLYEHLRKQHRRAFTDLLKRHRLDSQHEVVLYGPPASSILDALEGHHAEALIVGTIRRRGLDRLLMGSTVERLVGETPCDLIAVPAVAQMVAVIDRDKVAAETR